MRWDFRVSFVAAVAVSVIALPAFADDAPIPAAPVPAAPRPVEKMICKSEPETGSLVKRRKTCMTAKQQRYVNENNQADMHRFIDNNHITSN